MSYLMTCSMGTFVPQDCMLPICAPTLIVITNSCRNMRQSRLLEAIPHVTWDPLSGPLNVLDEKHDSIHLWNPLEC